MVAGCAIVLVFRFAILKELRQETATALAEEALLGFEIAADHIGDLHQGPLLEAHEPNSSKTVVAT
jgi:hypothetical protein